MTDLDAMKVEELKDLARERNLSGYSDMKKDELVQLLESHDEQGNPVNEAADQAAASDAPPAEQPEPEQPRETPQTPSQGSHTIPVAPTGSEASASSLANAQPVGTTDTLDGRVADLERRVAALEANNPTPGGNA